MAPTKRLKTTKIQTAKILVVHDAPDQLLALKAVLAKAGYQVTTAEGYVEGHGALRKDRYDLLISDFCLNGQNGQGLRLAEEAKRFAAPPSVVLVENREDRKNQVAPLRGSVDQYLFNPVGKKRLLACVERSLKKRKPAASGPPT